jgi:hypothetical protein
MPYFEILYFNGQIYQNIDTDAVDSEGNPLYPDIPISNLDAMKDLFIKTVRYQAWNELRKTDYYVAYCFEEGFTFDSKYPTIATLRDNIRNWASETETAINNTTTLDELFAIDIVLPETYKIDEFTHPVY